MFGSKSYLKLFTITCKVNILFSMQTHFYTPKRLVHLERFESKKIGQKNIPVRIIN